MILEKHGSCLRLKSAGDQVHSFQDPLKLLMLGSGTSAEANNLKSVLIFRDMVVAHGKL